jgi:hypothetical protein
MVTFGDDGYPGMLPPAAEPVPTSSRSPPMYHVVPSANSSVSMLPLEQIARKLGRLSPYSWAEV